MPLRRSAFGSPAEPAAWTPTWEDPDVAYTQEEWDAWDAQQAAAEAERARLNAIGKGGKGKGKG